MRTPVLSIVMTAFLACAPHLSSAGKGPPDWADTHRHPQYPAERYLLGVGVSEESMDRAKDDARLDITKQIKVQITSKMVDVQEYTQIGEQEYYRNQISSQTEMLVDETIAGIQVVETAQAQGVFYALAALDRGAFARELETALKEDIASIEKLWTDAERFAREGRIALALKNLSEAHPLSYEILPKRSLYLAIAPRPSTLDKGISPPTILSRIGDLLSHLRLEKISGDGQTAEPQAPLAEPLVARLVVVGADQETTPVEGMRIRFETADGKKLREVVTDRNGSAEIVAMAYGDRPVGRITARPVLSGMPPEVRRNLPITEVVFYYAVEREGYPVQIAIAMEDGAPAPKVETKLTKVLNKLGYVVDAESPILLKGEIVPGETKAVEGLGGTRVLAKAELDLSVTDLESGTVLESLTFSGKGMDKTEKAALRKAVKQIKIGKAALAPALRNAKQVFSAVRERKAKADFEEGEKLFRAGQYREALRKLEKVPVGTAPFLQAQEVIQTIQMHMPIVPSGR